MIQHLDKASRVDAKLGGDVLLRDLVERMRCGMHDAFKHRRTRQPQFEIRLLDLGKFAEQSVQIFRGKMSASCFSHGPMIAANSALFAGDSGLEVARKYRSGAKRTIACRSFSI